MTALGIVSGARSAGFRLRPWMYSITRRSPSGAMARDCTGRRQLPGAHRRTLRTAP